MDISDLIFLFKNMYAYYSNYNMALTLIFYFLISVAGIFSILKIKLNLQENSTRPSCGKGMIHIRMYDQHLFIQEMSGWSLIKSAHANIFWSHV